MNHLLYSRKSFEKREQGKRLRDLRALVVDHCPVDAVECHGNIWYMDTNAYDTRQFTLLNLHTLTLV